MSIHHVGNLRTYFVIFVLLVVGTWATYYFATIDMGPFNAPVAVFIACIKAALVIGFFMHLKDSNRLTKITAAGALFWLMILFVLTLTDFLSRAFS